MIEKGGKCENKFTSCSALITSSDLGKIDGPEAALILSLPLGGR